MTNANRSGYRVMVCGRGDCASPLTSRAIEQKLQALIAAHGLDDPDHPQHTRCTLTNCLGVCNSGPVLIVHPDGIKYHRVDDAALERIFQEHILQGRPVEELIVHRPDINRRFTFNL
ncbi:MAG: hypothetical protein Kow0031_06300 [Anaerolineae bacterium]